MTRSVTRSTRSRRRRLVVAAVGLVGVIAAAVCGPPAVHLGCAALRDRNATPLTTPPGPHDYGRLDSMAATHTVVLEAPVAHAEAQLREALALAQDSDLQVSIAGAKHSAGGQTMLPEGVYIDTAAFRCVDYDPATQQVTVCSGSRWVDVLEVLRPAGRAVKVMQSNSDFSVGGTISVNAHGWQNGMPPMGSTVVQMQVMNAAGELLTVSRDQHPELFRHVIGGYGLFGVIVEATLETVPDTAYRVEQLALPATELPARWSQIEAASAELMYARLSVAEDHRFADALLVSFSPSDEAAKAPPSADTLEGFPRWLFRGQAGSEYGKRLRWRLENWIGSAGGGTRQRSHIQQEPSAWFVNRDATRADALHEYFVPRDKLPVFVEQAAQRIGEHQADILNITIRAVSADTDSALPYARSDVFAAVLFFETEAGVSGDQAQAALARDLIELAIENGGTYYLPYRLHATPEQFHRAYPGAKAFFEARTRFDPQRRFSNYFAAKYGG